MDSSGTQVVSYAYDSWGKLISTTGPLASTVGAKNPYLYRGYRYDSETGLYYLQSRYYNPEWGRFINADEYGGKVGQLLSHNVFAYTENNPVNREDPTGQSWQLVGAVIEAVAGAVVGGIASDWDWRYMLAGAAAGALVGAGLGYAAEAAYGAIAAGVGAGVVAPKAVETLGKLRSIGNGSWESSKGLIYEQGSKQGNRVLHVLEHAKTNLTKPTHTVFNVARNQVLPLIDEAWTKRGLPLANDAGTYLINMGRVIGTKGETVIRLIVKPGTSKIITAYPFSQ